jgi:hypothetical protein
MQQQTTASTEFDEIPGSRRRPAERVPQRDGQYLSFVSLVSEVNKELQETQLIPETMGAFKNDFHQAQPKVDGGFLPLHAD